MSRWDLLLAVQEHDTHIDQLVHRSETLPVRAVLAKAEADTADVDRKLAEVDERLGALSRSQQRLEDEIASLKDKASSVDRQLYSGTVSNPRELQAMQEEITSIQRRVSDLEDDQLDVMEATEPVDAERAALAAGRERLDAQAGHHRAELAEGEAAIEQELAQVREERARAVAQVPDELWPEYERLRAALGGVAIARLAGSTCQGCHLQLSAIEVDRIKKLPAGEPVHCEECGRLLVHS